MAGEKSGEGDTNQLIISEGKNNNKIRDVLDISHAILHVEF